MIQIESLPYDSSFHNKEVVVEVNSAMSRTFPVELGEWKTFPAKLACDDKQYYLCHDVEHYRGSMVNDRLGFLYSRFLGNCGCNIKHFSRYYRIYIADVKIVGEI